MIFLSKTMCKGVCGWGYPGDKSLNFNSEPLDSEMEYNTKDFGSVTDVGGWIKRGIIIF